MLYCCLSLFRCNKALCVDIDDIVNTFNQLEYKHFYKSMDSDIQRKIRHDVYHFPHLDSIIYIKFQLTDDNSIDIIEITSFKEK